MDAHATSVGDGCERAWRARFEASRRPPRDGGVLTTMLNKHGPRRFACRLPGWPNFGRHLARVDFGPHLHNSGPTLAASGRLWANFGQTRVNLVDPELNLAACGRFRARLGPHRRFRANLGRIRARIWSTLDNFGPKAAETGQESVDSGRKLSQTWPQTTTTMPPTARRRGFRRALFEDCFATPAVEQREHATSPNQRHR